MALPELKNNGWIGVPWAEFVGKDGAHGLSFSSGWDQGNQSTFNILIYWEDALQAEQDILGVSWFDGTSLHRTPPVRHPFKPWMRAERIISAHPMRWDNKVSQPMALYGNGNSLDYGTMSAYDYWLLSIGFIAPSYRVIDDTTLQNYFGGYEWNRFCEVEQVPEFMTITREAGVWHWADTTNPGSPGYEGYHASSPTNVNFNAPWGQTMTSWRIRVLWKRVPRYGLFADAGFSDLLNANFTTLAGSLHNGAHPLWTAVGNSYSGTLRFVNAHATPRPSPFSPVSQLLGPLDSNLYYDVAMEFHLFDPPTYANSIYRGHNLAPSPNPADPYWYLITNSGFDDVSGAVLGQGIYPTNDLTELFQLSVT